ncbi:unnamed protein product [Callosobruchus maculatus]|uniref:Secreted protein n=1 Tax=Callosobruchus maculatus TaxID=64391 RepID=A0A653BYT0_CALMS|nr:unnamed protein product [Callosobruchus maculatus]
MRNCGGFSFTYGALLLMLTLPYRRQECDAADATKRAIVGLRDGNDRIRSPSKSWKTIWKRSCSAGTDSRSRPACGRSCPKKGGMGGTGSPQSTPSRMRSGATTPVIRRRCKIESMIIIKQ